MTKLLLPLLLYMSGVLNPFEVNEPKTILNRIYDPGVETLIYPGAIEIAVDNEMCKPTGVETVIYTDAKPEPAPVKKETVKAKKQPVVKTTKGKSVKKVLKKKA